LSLKGVLIDFGDTLACFDEENNRKYLEGLLSILKRYGYLKNVDDLDLFLGELYYRSSKGEVKTFNDFWKLLLKKIRVLAEPKLLKELDLFRSHNYATIFKLYVGVIPALSDLGRKYRLALVSNCSVGLSDVLRALGIARYFDGIILSYEIGVRKPDKRIYLDALRSVKLRAYECIFVSDEISDLEGAKDVGLRTLLVRQGSHTTYEARNPNFKPDLECDHVSEITRLL
jgi:HAD superfamily hydrolase (TIGR01549 family)